MTARTLILPALVLSAGLALAQQPVDPPLPEKVGKAKANQPGPKVVVLPERTRVEVGQPVRINLLVRNTRTAPEVETAAADGLSVGPAGPPAARPSMLADLESIRPGGRIPGHGLIESFRELTTKMPADQIDPEVLKKLGGPDLLKEYQASLASLNELNRDDYTFAVLVVPEKAGRLTVPAFTIRSGSQTTTTTPVSIDVVGTKSQDWVKMEQSLSNPSPLPGEEVQLNVDLLVRRGPVTFNQKIYPHYPLKGMTLAVAPDKGTPVDIARPFAEVLRERAVGPGQVGFAVNNRPGQIKLDHEDPPAAGQKPDDSRWYRRRLTIPVRFRKAGTVELPPVRSGGEVYLASTTGHGRWEGFAAISEPLKVTVRDPGTAPSDFNGAIGVFKLTAGVSQSKMPVGTPFSLTLRQEGQGNLRGASAPDLARRPEFADAFQVHADGDKLLAEGVREYTYTLRPRNEGVREVPSVTVTSLDPKTGKYVQARSEPVPLEVTPGGVFTAEPSEATAPDEQPAGTSWWGVLGRVAGWLAALGVLAVAGWYFGRRVRSNWVALPLKAPRPRPDEAILLARSRLRVPGLTTEGIRRAVQEYLRARCDLPPGEITPLDAHARLAQAGYPIEMARQAAEVLGACTMADFGPGLSGSTRELAATAGGLLDAIEAARPESATIGATDEVDALTRARREAVSG